MASKMRITIIGPTFHPTAETFLKHHLKTPCPVYHPQLSAEDISIKTHDVTVNGINLKLAIQKLFKDKSIYLNFDKNQTLCRVTNLRRAPS